MSRQIAVKDFRKQLEEIGLKVTPNLLRSGEEDINSQLEEMKQELKEKKLLDYQLKSKKGTVNEFLKAKYSDGNFNTAVYNGYDNSENRIKHDITFDYHIYFPKSGSPKDPKIDRYADSRPNFSWILTKPITSKIGDSYTYHIPIRKGVDSEGKASYITDENELLTLDGDSKSKNGLIFALNELHINMKKDVNKFSPMTYNILKEYGFIENNKINLDIPGLVVEKYLKAYKPSKYQETIEYLNKDFEKEDDVEIAKDTGPKLEEEKVIAKNSISNEEIKRNIRQIKNLIEDKLSQFKFDTKIKNEESLEAISNFNQFREEKEELMNDEINGEELEKSIEEIEKIEGELKEKFDETVATLNELTKNQEELHNKITEEMSVVKRNFEVNYSLNTEKEYKDYITNLINEQEKTATVINKRKEAEEILKKHKDLLEKANKILDENTFKTSYKTKAESIISSYQKSLDKKNYDKILKKSKTNDDNYENIQKLILKEESRLEKEKLEKEKKELAESKKLEIKKKADEDKNKLKEELERIKNEEEIISRRVDEEILKEITVTDNLKLSIPEGFKIINKQQNTRANSYSSISPLYLILRFNKDEKVIEIAKIQYVHNKNAEDIRDEIRNFNKLAKEKIENGEDYKIITFGKKIDNIYQVLS